MNPDDCTCEHVHCSSRTCRSTATSKGAVPESERLFPARSIEPPAPLVVCDAHQQGPHTKITTASFREALCINPRPIEPSAPAAPQCNCIVEANDAGTHYPPCPFATPPNAAIEEAERAVDNKLREHFFSDTPLDGNRVPAREIVDAILPILRPGGRGE